MVVSNCIHITKATGAQAALSEGGLSFTQLSWLLGGKLAATATLNKSRQRMSWGIFRATEAKEVPVSAGATHVEGASEEVAEAPEVLFAPEAAPVEAAPVQEVTVVSEEVAGTEPEVNETNEVSTLVEAHLQYLCWKLICWRTNKHWFVQTNKHCTPYLVSSNWTVALVCLNSSLNNLFSERGEFFLF